MALYRPLCELSLGDIAEFGGKAARLGEAMRLGCPVLDGVALSVELYWRFMRQGGLQGEIRSILTTLQPQSIGQFQAAEWAIRGAFEVRRVPEDVGEVIHQAWTQLGAERVAVRSSATNEDSPQQSFVGQHMSFLNVADADAAVKAVLACWSSLFSAQALSYAHSFGVDLLSSAMGVLMQPMVEGSAWGAIFSVDPVNGDADRFLLSEQGGEHAGLHILDPYAPLADEAPPRWGQLRDIALLLDERQMAYQSLDWVQADDRVYLLRARPVTGAPNYLPAEALDCAPLELELAWLHEPDTTPRAVQPLSWYHMSRGPSLRQAFYARSIWPLASSDAPFTCYPCGYLYASALSERTPPLPVEPLRRWFQDLRLLLRVRNLDRDYITLCEQSLGHLQALNHQELGSLGDKELASTLVEITALHEAFREQSGLLQRVDAALRQQLARMHRRWLPGRDYDLDLLLWTKEASSEAERRLDALASTSFASQGERSAAIEVYFQQYRHYFIPDDLWAPWRDLATIAPSREMLEKALSARQQREPSEDAQRSPAQQQTLRAILAHLGRVRGRGYSWLLRLAQHYNRLALESRAVVALCCLLESDIVREVGRRLGESGKMPTKEASLLTCDEILAWLRGSMSDEVISDTLGERQATRRRWARYSPPERLTRAQEKPSEPQVSHNQRLTGRGVSAGQVSGHARVVRSMTEANQVLPGEVLVCQELPLAFTPLFSIIAAVVTEKGDLLDHAGVLAREYGVPAVFGVREATQRIQTGDTLEVYGAQGIVVRCLPEPEWELWAI